MVSLGEIFCRQNLGGGLQVVWVSSDWLVVRQPGSAWGILCSAWSYLLHHWIIKKVRSFQKNIYFCFIDNAEAFDCVDYNKLWKTLQEMGISDHRTCLLRNLYAGQEATVRTGHGTTDGFQIGKEVRQGCILSPCLFNLYAEYIMHAKCQAEWSASWNQDCWEKYQ